jgi:hypothetical protein
MADDDRRFPAARWDDEQIAKIVHDLMERFSARDRKIMLRDALLYRRTDNENATGQYMPPPFDKSRTIIKHASGILVDRAQFLSAQAAENSPNIQVNIKTTSNDQPSGLAFRKAKSEEDALNAIYWEADQTYESPMQGIAAFSAITKGVGWYLSYENAIGWNAPSRAFYTDLTPEEIDKLGGADSITDVFPKQGEEFRYAEDLDLFERRKLDSQRNAAEDGSSLFVVEVLAPGVVYYRKDTAGLSLGLVIEEVPMWDMEDEFGVVEDEHGNVVIGPDRGGPAHNLSTTQQTYIRTRVFTRDEVYYYISKHQGGRPDGRGTIVFHTKHDMGEVPLYPAAANQTDSALPEEEFIPTLEGAYAVVPGFNQIQTLLSGAAVFNTTPRYVIIRSDGSPILDPDTNEPLIMETQSTAGLDPEIASVINTGGGEFKQLKIENVNDLINLLEFWSAALDQTLPPEAATGASGSEEPAWGTRLKQAAAQVKIQPVVTNHPRAVRRMARMWARVIRHRKQKVIVYGKPHRRGKVRSVRAEIELDPKDLSLDLSVFQDDADAQTKIVRTQVGLELLQAGVTDPITFQEQYKGEDDPYGAQQAADAWKVVQALMPQMVQRIMNRVQGRLVADTPAEEQMGAEVLAANAPRPDGQLGEPAAAAGIRQPGMEMGTTQDSLPPLSGPNGAPLPGGPVA